LRASPAHLSFNFVERGLVRAGCRDSLDDRLLQRRAGLFDVAPRLSKAAPSLDLGLHLVFKVGVA
jgi:hypothetical protein